MLCQKCNLSMEKPSLWHIRDGRHHCQHCRHTEHLPRIDALIDYIQDLEDHIGQRLANLEHSALSSASVREVFKP